MDEKLLSLMLQTVSLLFHRYGKGLGVPENAEDRRLQVLRGGLGDLAYLAEEERTRSKSFLNVYDHPHPAGT